MIKGFTLVELVIVIVIVAVLSIVAVNSYQVYVEKTILTEMATTAKDIGDACISYYLQYNKFPNRFNQLDIQIDTKSKGFTNTTSYSMDYVMSSKYFSYTIENHTGGLFSIVCRRTKEYTGNLFTEKCSYRNYAYSYEERKFRYGSLIIDENYATEAQKIAIKQWAKKNGI